MRQATRWYRDLWRRNAILALWLAAFLLFLVFFAEPIKTEKVRLATLLFAGALWFLSLLLLWRRRKWAAILFAGLTLAAVLFLISPGRPANPDALRQAYIRALLRYRGAYYMWGGENRLAIDCSGLVRCGIIDANLEEGLRTANAGLVREGLSISWHDCSAGDLGDGYNGRTQYVSSAKNLNALDCAPLMPGDLAVIDEDHVLAYLGNKTWIEASPIPMRVVTEKAPSSDPYFNMQARIVRWRELNGH